MNSERANLMETAASVADGSDVDWPAIEGRLANDDDRRLLQHLRIIAGIADVHRSTPDDAPQRPASARGRIVGTILPERESPRPKLPPGTPAMWGHLELLEKVGEGTFGEVFRARDTHLQRDVALKLLRLDRGPAARLARRMVHEGRVLAKVRHSHVVNVFGAEERDGRVGLWMEYLKGSTLDAILARQGAMSAREAALIGQDLCRALAAVHGAGLVHRDIKAQNVMREQGGRVVLMDFGAGVLRDRAAGTRAGRITGTPLYLAPELLDGGDATVQTDIYALGVLLYHLVTLTYPVDATTLDQLRAAHEQGRLKRLHDARPDLPDGFVAVVERALQPAPERRFASAGAMQAALAGSLGLDPARTADLDVTTEGRPAPLGLTTSLGKRRAPEPIAPLKRLSLAKTAAGVCAVLVLGLALGWWVRTKFVGGADQRPLLVVRPFTAATVGEEFFASGLTEHVVTGLGRLRSALAVSPASATSALAGDTPPTEVLSRLRADYLVQGRVDRAKGAATVTVSLLRAGAGSPFWSRSYTRSANTLLKLEDDIVGGVRDALRVAKSADALKVQAERVMPQAAEAYLRGRYQLHLLQPDRAIAPLTEAVELQPDFAAAWAVLGRAYLDRREFPHGPRAESVELGRAAAHRAVALDPNLPEAHATLGSLAFYGDWDWALAEEEYNRALNLDPANETARFGLGQFLASRRRVEEALSVIEEGQRLNPLSAELTGYLGITRHYARDHTGAIAEFRKALVLNPKYFASYIGLCRAHRARGELALALRACQAAVEAVEATSTDTASRLSSLTWNGYRAQLGQVLAAMGRSKEARAILDELTSRRAAQPYAVMSESVARLHASLGDADAAFEWLDAAIAERSTSVLYLAVDPRMDPLRTDPRFASLLAQLGLTP